MNREIAVQIERYGNSNSLQVVDVQMPSPNPTEARVRHTAIGVNYVDIYHRSGAYPLPQLPAVLGVEAVGVVEAIGAEVADLIVGQRVAYAGLPSGSYATARNISSQLLIPLPDDLEDLEVANTLLRGITAHMLFNYVYPIQDGQTLLVHAAAGGLGQLIGQWCSPWNVTLIGTVGSPEKAAVARSQGYDHTIEYRREDFVEIVHQLTNGQGVDYAIDGIGGKTLLKTLDAVRAYGMVASVGQVSGDLGFLTLSELGPKRSLALSRPGVMKFMSDRDRYRKAALETIQRLQQGIRIAKSLILPLHQAQEAHQLMEAGKTAGAVILLPE